jgi:hypothetical protein
MVFALILLVVGLSLPTIFQLSALLKNDASPVCETAPAQFVSAQLADAAD